VRARTFADYLLFGRRGEGAVQPCLRRIRQAC
jgi:hypothetical protein